MHMVFPPPTINMLHHFAIVFFKAPNSWKTQLQLRNETSTFLRRHSPFKEIIVNGVDDIQKFFQQFLQLHDMANNFVDVGLPQWENRATIPAHQLAICAKEQGLNPPPLTFHCDIQVQHSAQRFRRRATVATLSQLGRSSGCHCSLYDVMELFYYMEAITAV